MINEQEPLRKLHEGDVVAYCGGNPAWQNRKFVYIMDEPFGSVLLQPINMPTVGVVMIDRNKVEYVGRKP